MHLKLDPKPPLRSTPCCPPLLCDFLAKTTIYGHFFATHHHHWLPLAPSSTFTTMGSHQNPHKGSYKGQNSPHSIFAAVRLGSFPVVFSATSSHPPPLATSPYHEVQPPSLLLAPSKLHEHVKWGINPFLILKFFKFLGLLLLWLLLLGSSECIHIIFIVFRDIWFGARILNFDYVNWFKKKSN